MSEYAEMRVVDVRGVVEVVAAFERRAEFYEDIRRVELRVVPMAASNAWVGRTDPCS